MMEFIKKQGIAFWLMTIAVVLSVVGIIMTLVSNGVQGYAIHGLALIIWSVIIAIICIAGCVYFSDKMGGHAIVPAVLGLIATLLLVYAFANIVLNRADLIAAVETYDAVNLIGKRVARISIAAMVFYLVSAVLVAASAFLAKDKE